jgi:hypothetical protein
VLSAVFDLPRDDGPARPVEQRLVVAAHDEERHQVFEHGRRPGDEGVPPVDARQLPPQTEPVLLRRVAFGDGDEAGEACLGSQQVVVRIVGAPRRRVVADVKDFPLGVEEERKIHPLEHFLAPLRQTTEAGQDGVNRERRVFHRRVQRREAVGRSRRLGRLLPGPARERGEFGEHGVVGFGHPREAVYAVERGREFRPQRGGLGGTDDVSQVGARRVSRRRESSQVARKLFRVPQQRARPELNLREIARAVLLREGAEHVVGG